MANVFAALPNSDDESSRRGSQSLSALAFDPTVESDRLELAGIVVHLGDLSGQAYPRQTAIRWGNMVSEEFRRQAKVEATKGYPTNPVLQNLDTDLQVYKSQVGFIQFVLLPLWQNATDVFQELREPLSQLRSNLMFYQNEVERLSSSDCKPLKAGFIPATEPYSAAGKQVQPPTSSSAAASSAAAQGLSASGVATEGGSIVAKPSSESSESEVETVHEVWSIMERMSVRPNALGHIHLNSVLLWLLTSNNNELQYMHIVVPFNYLSIS